MRIIITTLIILIQFFTYNSINTYKIKNKYCKIIKVINTSNSNKKWYIKTNLKKQKQKKKKPLTLLVVKTSSQSPKLQTLLGSVFAALARAPQK